MNGRITLHARVRVGVQLLAVGVVAALFPSGVAQAVANTWTSASGGPAARFGASMAYDPTIGRVVLFGGCSGLTTAGKVIVTLKDGTTREFDPNANPPKPWRWCPPGSQYNDTWLWNGANSTWTQIFPTGTLPNKRLLASMAYDYKSDRLVLFGGLYEADQTVAQPAGSELCFQEETSGEGIAGVESVSEPSASRTHLYYCFADTWTLVGSIGGPWQWQKLTTPTTPSTRFDAGMAFDGSGRPTLIGGCHRMGLIGTHVVPTDPTTWDCTEYTEVESGGEESCIIPALELFCAEDEEYEATDSWRFTWIGPPGTGTPTWEQVGCLAPTPDGLCAPSEVMGAAVTFNPATRKVHLWGGWYFEPRQGYGGYMGNIWEFDGTTWQKVMGQGTQDQWCPSLSAVKAWTSGTPVYDVNRWKILDFGGSGKYYSASPSCPDQATAQQDPYYSNGTINRYVDPQPRQYNDTWLWDSASCTTIGPDKMCWQQPPVDRDSLQNSTNLPPSSLSRRHGAAVAFDPGSGKVVLFGGLSGTSGMSDTWILQATASGDPCGATC